MRSCWAPTQSIIQPSCQRCYHSCACRGSCEGSQSMRAFPGIKRTDSSSVPLSVTEMSSLLSPLKAVQYWTAGTGDSTCLLQHLLGTLSWLIYKPASFQCSPNKVALLETAQQAMAPPPLGLVSLRTSMLQVYQWVKRGNLQPEFPPGGCGPITSMG